MSRHKEAVEATTARKREHVQHYFRPMLRVGVALGVITVGLAPDLSSINYSQLLKQDSRSSRIERVINTFASTAEADGGTEGMGRSIPGGRFYNETNGGIDYNKGYSVTGPMWKIYEQMGREYTWGPPVSQAYTDEMNRMSQVFQRGVFQLTMTGNQAVKVEWLNTFDELSKRGKDDWLQVVRQTPSNGGWPQDVGKSWDQIVTNHLNLLDQNQAIKQEYMKDPQRIEKYGLPVAIKDYGNVIVIRCQRGTFQQWKENVPWAKAGDVTIALGGSILIEAGGIIPQSALALETFQLENPAAIFPKEIGNLARDGVVIHNMGTRIGVVDNKEDPQNNWQAVVNVYKQYAPNDRFEFFFYDNPADVPAPETLQTPYRYDPVQYWRNEFPEADNQGRITVGRTSDGTWQLHMSLITVNPENQNKLSRSVLGFVLAYSYNKDITPGQGNSQPTGFAAILRQQIGDPYNSGRMNMSLKVVSAGPSYK